MNVGKTLDWLKAGSLVTWLERRCLFWWEPRKDGPNAGDYLARSLVEAILGLADRHIVDKRDKARRLFAIGSILHYARSGETVWGSGVNGKIPAASHRFSDLDVRAVRGPLTQSFLHARGIACPSVFGDPALLAPLFFPAELVAEEMGDQDFVVVPHLNDPPEYYHRYGGRLCSPRQYPVAFIRRLLRGRMVVSASLHGIVLAEAYGLPAVLLDIGGGEARFKYEDYYAGTGRNTFRVAHSVEEARALGSSAPPPDLATLCAGLLGAFPYDLWDADEAAPAIRAAHAPGAATTRA